MVLRALMYGWTLGELASRLGCPAAAASGVMQGLLTPLPQLASWKARIEALDSPSCSLTTLAGRHIAVNCKVGFL